MTAQTQTQTQTAEKTVKQILAEAEARVAARIAATPPPPERDRSDPVCAQCRCYGPVGDDGRCYSCRTYDQRQQGRIDDCRAAVEADRVLAQGGVRQGPAWCRRCGGPCADGSGDCGECQ